MEGLGAKGLKTKLIVNYLPQGLSDVEFRNMFGSVGELESCKVMRDKGTGYSFGYGFVDFIKPSDAELAISKLNGYKIGNKTLRVAYSKPPGSSKNTNLYVSGLVPEIDEKRLDDLFRPYGEIVQTRILRNSDNSSKNVGFVLFKDKDNADSAIRALQGYSDNSGVKIQIKYAKDSIEQQKTHPKFQEFIYQKFMEQNPAVFNQQPAMNYPHDPQQMNPQMGYQDPYGGGYSNQAGYGMVGDGGQKAVRGRDVSARYNPIARPGGAGGGMGMGMGMGMGGAPGGGMQQEPAAIALFVYNIGPNATEADLYALFSRFGRITKVNVIEGKGYGFVHMPIPMEANEAMMSLNGQTYNGKQLQVSVKTKK